LIRSAFGNIGNAERYVSVYVFRRIYRYFQPKRIVRSGLSLIEYDTPESIFASAL